MYSHSQVNENNSYLVTLKLIILTTFLFKNNLINVGKIVEKVIIKRTTFVKFGELSTLETISRQVQPESGANKVALGILQYIRMV